MGDTSTELTWLPVQSGRLRFDPLNCEKKSQAGGRMGRCVFFLIKKFFLNPEMYELMAVE